MPQANSCCANGFANETVRDGPAVNESSSLVTGPLPWLRRSWHERAASPAAGQPSSSSASPQVISPEHHHRDRRCPRGKRVKVAPAAPLARRQRRAQPRETRPAHAGPRSLATLIK